MDGSTVHFPARAPQNSQGTSPPGRGGIAGRVTGREGGGLQWMVGGSCAVPRLSWQKFDWMVASIRRASTFSRSALPTAAHSPLVSAVRLEVDVCGGDTGQRTASQPHKNEALSPSARYERRVGVSLVRAAWERRPEGPAYLLSSVTLLYLAGLCAF